MSIRIALDRVLSEGPRDRVPLAALIEDATADWPAPLSPKEWLTPILREPLDAFVLATHPTSVPQHSHPTNRLEDNVQEAQRLLAVALDRRREYLDLENEALGTVLDLLLAEELHQSDYEIAELNRKASCRLAEVDDPDAHQETLKARFTSILESRRVRALLLVQPGGARNYGQRLRFMRDVYADTIRLLYARLFAIWIGAEAHFGVSAVKPPPWAAEGGSLENLIFWLRALLDTMNRGDREEQFRDVFFPLSSILGKDAVGKQLNSGAAARFEFELTGDHVGGLQAGKRCRLLAFACAPSFSDMSLDLEKDFVVANMELDYAEHMGHLNNRFIVPALARRLDLYRQRMAECVFDTAVELPAQSTPLDIEEKTWLVPPLTRQGVGAWIGGTASNALPVDASPGLRNISPIGNWKLTVGGDVRTPAGTTKLASPFAKDAWHKEGITESRFGKSFELADVVVFMRLAVRNSVRV